MSTTLTAPKKETTVSPVDNQKGIENHKKAAEHHQEAAKQHLEAAKHHESGNHDKAAQATVKANGQSVLANEAHKEDAKHHAMKS